MTNHFNMWHIVLPHNDSALSPKVYCGAPNVQGHTTRADLISPRMVNTGVVCTECWKAAYSIEEEYVMTPEEVEALKEPSSYAKIEAQSLPKRRSILR